MKSIFLEIEIIPNHSSIFHDPKKLLINVSSVVKIESSPNGKAIFHLSSEDIFTNQNYADICVLLKSITTHC